MHFENVPTEPYFDLKSARETLRWLKPRIEELRELGKRGRLAMESYDMETADACTRQIHEILDEINSRGVVVRDSEVSLVDFPAVVNKMPAYLCWAYGETDIEYWHYLEDGFAGRTRISGDEDIMDYL